MEISATHLCVLVSQTLDFYIVINTSIIIEKDIKSLICLVLHNFTHKHIHLNETFRFRFYLMFQ